MTPPLPLDDFRSHWHEIKARFDRDAPAWIERSFAAATGGDTALIERLVTDGKTARGCLTCLVCEALGGALDAAMPRAVLIECVQAATLVHDDVIDGDATRRGQPALWTVLGQRRAILLGDLMFAVSLAEAARLGRDDVATLAEAIGTVASGAYREPLDRRDIERSASRGDGASLYERVIHCKTGALFGAAGSLGAIAAGAPQACAKAACAFATRVGEAYQIADDIEDLLGTPDDGSAQRAAVLATMRAHFAGRRSEGGALQPRLRREIARRLGLARRAVDGFAEGPPAALLNAAPAFIVGLQSH